MLKALAHLQRSHGSRDHLRVRMSQAGAGIEPVILENSNQRDARVQAQLIVASLINAHDFRDIRIRHERQNLWVVGRLDDYIVNSKAVYRSAGTVEGPGGLRVARKSRKFVRYHPRVPRNVHRGRYAQNFRRSQLFITRAKKTVRNKRCHIALAPARHFFGTPRPLGCDDNPFLGGKISGIILTFATPLVITSR